MKKKHKYLPSPIDTSSVQLPADLLGKMEFIAKNVHEEWAEGRIVEGWQYGSTRDDLNRYHPGLVPYDDLSEEEKDYDRQTALSTIKLLVSLGFCIERKET